jgi:DNA-damage-inducible protein J
MQMMYNICERGDDMTTKSISFRVDEELKNEADLVLEEIGLSMTAALTLYLKQIVNRREIPFKLEAKDPFYSEENQLILQQRILEYERGKAKKHDLIEAD